MASRSVIVAAPEGLHARPAALFVRLAGEQPTPVTIRRPDGTRVPATSILAVMTLGVRAGDEVVIEADGPDGDAAVAALAELLTQP